MKYILKSMVVTFGCVLTIALLAAIAMAEQQAAAGPFATEAKVSVKSQGTVIALKREEQIAFMFVQAISSLEDDCGRHAAEPCTLATLVRGPKGTAGWALGKLKFDPNASDPNYSYKVALDESKWEIWANPRKPGLGGFYVKEKFGGRWYNPAGPATASHTKIDEFSISGDSFTGR
jgi:hypothetical protein